MKERSSNIELLRILAMMAIVLGHCLRQNDCFLAMPNVIFASGMLRIAARDRRPGDTAAVSGICR